MQGSPEQFFVELSNPSHGTIYDGDATGVIQDNDPALTTWLRVGSVSLWEPDSGTIGAVVSIRLSEVRGVDTTFTLEVVPNAAFSLEQGVSPTTADRNVDFTFTGPQTRTVTIKAGRKFANLTLKVLGDAELEGTETIALRVSEGTPAVSTIDGTLTILADD